ncbi:alpha-N-acetylglucosaminidase-like [Chrysoperla carnea]|uniref:alpha-N-acetylglucosaminidase-like n=1 Tax=Chrysoperla carnea TaxID=189513 RepID=UPI001D07EB8D|nr:alpha-N-acetylglucosaminidase-like [Chrysoperla carnea]
MLQLLSVSFIVIIETVNFCTGAGETINVFNQLQTKVPEDIQAQTVKRLIQQLIPDRADSFVVNVNAALRTPDGRDVFILKKLDDNGTVNIEGSSGVAAAWGFNHYLKFFCNCQVAWETEQLSLPKTLPNVDIRIKANDRFRYYQNVCTSSYTFAWWDWTQWEKHIYWMALNGINLPLAFTAQEAIWDRVYRKYFNLTDNDIDEHFTGPGFFAWERMGNMRGFGGPLTNSWHNATIALQKQILELMRSLGMIPVLTAFAGHVPRAFKNLFPSSNMVLASRWNSFEDKYCCPYLLDPTDPLFKVIGKLYVEETIAEFGTDHVYACDPFNELTPSTTNETYLESFGERIFGTMLSADQDAVWVLQGWFMVNAPQYWSKSRIKAFLSKIPIGSLLILDLMSELFPQYKLMDNYFGHYFIWCMLHNFGGTLGNFGSIPNINKGIFDARTYNGSTMIGAGLTPEGILQNYVVYDFMVDMFWRPNSVNLSEWFTEYIGRRYGQIEQHSNNAWQILKAGIYNYTGTVHLHGAYVYNIKPSTKLQPSYWYDVCEFFEAWDEFVNAADTLSESEAFQYDIVDFSRQALQILADEYYNELIRAFKNKDIDEFQRTVKLYLNIFDDVEKLLNSNKNFLLGNWLEMAKKLGEKYEAYPGQFEYNARNQITLWGPNGEIDDYANKQWAGIVSDFFKPRWEVFLEGMNTSLITGTKFNEAAQKSKVFKEVEQPFTFSRKLYPTDPKGNSIEIAKIIHKRWWLDSRFKEQCMYRLTPYVSIVN